MTPTNLEGMNQLNIGLHFVDLDYYIAALFQPR
jgi:hypothetical protein